MRPSQPQRAVIALAGLFAWGCQQPANKPAPVSPAKVAAVAQEGKLNTLELTEDAEKRLGITLATVVEREVHRVRTYSGEIALPPGASLVISAPVGGKLQAPGSATVPEVGALVAASQPIFVLTPLLSPERDVLTPAERIALAQAKNAIATSRIDAAGQVEQARVQVEAAKIALERAERLYRESAGTARAVDDAKAQHGIATKGLEAAQSRLKLLDEINLEGGAGGEQTPLVLEAPQGGLIRTRSAAPGEVVAAGAPLFEVMRFNPIWVRVPVYAGETSDLALDQPAQVAPLNAGDHVAALEARPIAAPPTATPLSATVDLYYELPNPDAKLRPGERVTVRVKLPASSGPQRVIPWSAVIHDISGGTWVYEQTAERTYVRRRVQVRYVVEEEGQQLAVLAGGPELGAKVATAAVVELFGTEFGFAK